MAKGEARARHRFERRAERKVWARLRHKGVRTSKERVRRLMRENQLSAGTGQATPRGPQAHDGTIIPETIDSMWGEQAAATGSKPPANDMTAALTTGHGQVAFGGQAVHWTPCFFRLTHRRRSLLGGMRRHPCSHPRHAP